MNTYVFAYVLHSSGSFNTSTGKMATAAPDWAMTSINDSTFDAVHPEYVHEAESE